MKAIRTRFYGPSNFKGSRYMATDGDGHSITLNTNYELNSDANHERVANALMRKMGWPNELVGGGFESDMYWTMLPLEKGAKH